MAGPRFALLHMASDTACIYVWLSRKKCQTRQIRAVGKKVSEVNHTVSEVGLIGEFHGSRLLVAGVLGSASEFEERTQVGFHIVFYQCLRLLAYVISKTHGLHSTLRVFFRTFYATQ